MEDEYFTFSHMSKQDSDSDINVDDTQNPENPHTPKTLQIHTPSGPKYLQHFFLCDPHRTRRFCTRVGLAISEYHPIDEYKLQITQVLRLLSTFLSISNLST